MSHSIETKADDFAYITFKMQSTMYEIDAKFYSFENTVKRINSCIFACANGNKSLLHDARVGIIRAFNRLKNEENLPMLSYRTITEIVKVIDNKLEKRSA